MRLVPAAVGENHEGEFFLWHPADGRRKPARPAVMMNQLGVMPVFDSPTKPVTNRGAVIEGSRGEDFLENVGGENRFSIECLVPFKVIVQGSVDSSIPEDGAGHTLVVPLKLMVGFLITNRAMRDGADTFFMDDGLGHSEGLEDTGFDKVRERLPGVMFHNQRQQRIPGIAVTVLCPGREIGLLFSFQ